MEYIKLIVKIQKPYAKALIASKVLPQIIGANLYQTDINEPITAESFPDTERILKLINGKMVEVNASEVGNLEIDELTSDLLIGTVIEHALNKK